MKSSTCPKIKVLGIVFSSYDHMVYSKFYTKYASPSISKSQYDLTSLAGQQKLSKALLGKSDKTRKSKMKPTDTQIFSFNLYTVLFKYINQLQLFLICEQDQNYPLMQEVMNCMLNIILRFDTDHGKDKESYNMVGSMAIAIDQIIDEGLIINLDPNVVYQRMKMRDQVETGSSKKIEAKNDPKQQGGGGTFSALFGLAKNTLQKTLNVG